MIISAVQLEGLFSAVVSLLVSLWSVRAFRSTGSVVDVSLSAQSRVQTGGDVLADRVDHVCIAMGHSRVRPAHDSHHGAFVYSEQGEHGGGRVSCVVQTAVRHVG
jgi:hypothetical protein